MTFEEFEKATTEELRAEAKKAFDEANLKPSWGGSPTLSAQAQFYMQELDRRDGSAERKHGHRVENRSLLLEIFVIALIGVEILLSVLGIWLSIKEGKNEEARMDKQDQILTNLQKSTDATAKLLEQQLDLESTLSLNVEFDGEDTVTLFNNSRSQMSLAGVKVGDIVPKIKGGKSTTIADHNMTHVRLSEYNPKLIDQLRERKEVAFQ